MGISILGAGSVFIPKEKIKNFRKLETLRERLSISIFSKYFMVIEHTSEEIRKPVILPIEIAQKLQEVITK